MSRIRIDPDSDVVAERFAVIYSPGRRDRYPDNCVEIYESAEAAVAAADPAKKRVAAVVLGPSRSSEGFLIYYLVRWLSS
jgi:hypothetical protein